MTSAVRAVHGLMIAATLSIIAVGTAEADIVEFGNFAGWTPNKSDDGTASTIAPGSIRLTSRGGAQGRSVFYNTAQDITRFEASFTYRSMEASGGGYGAAFILQNDADGPAAVGGSAGNLGYHSITDSIGLSLELASGGVSRSGLYFDGNVGGGATSMGPVDLFSGNPIAVQLTYDGSILRANFADTISSAAFESSYLVDLPAIVGSSTALVGLSASTNGLSSSAHQHFSDFRFQSVPEPASLALAAIGCGLLALRFHVSRSRRRALLR